jgi:hypothetical protein
MITTANHKTPISQSLETGVKGIQSIREIDLRKVRRRKLSLDQNDICCEDPILHEERGFSVCINCGIVHEMVIDTTPRRAFTAEEVRNRKGNEPVYSKIGPRTVMRGSRDAKGVQLNAEQKLKYSRLAKIHRSLTTSYERNLWVALPNLDRFQEQLGLPDRRPPHLHPSGSGETHPRANQ